MSRASCPRKGRVGRSLHFSPLRVYLCLFRLLKGRIFFRARYSASSLVCVCHLGESLVRLFLFFFVLVCGSEKCACVVNNELNPLLSARKGDYYRAVAHATRRATYMLSIYVYVYSRPFAF